MYNLLVACHPWIKYEEYPQPSTSWLCPAAPNTFMTPATIVDALLSYLTPTPSSVATCIATPLNIVHQWDGSINWEWLRLNWDAVPGRRGEGNPSVDLHPLHGDFL